MIGEQKNCISAHTVANTPNIFGRARRVALQEILDRAAAAPG